MPASSAQRAKRTQPPTSGKAAGDALRVVRTRDVSWAVFIPTSPPFGSIQWNLRLIAVFFAVRYPVVPEPQNQSRANCSFDLNLHRPGNWWRRDVMTSGPSLERPRLRVNVAISAQQLPCDRIGLRQIVPLGTVQVNFWFHPAISITV